MAAHSSVLAWRIPGTGEPGGLPSMGSHRVGHDWSDLAAAAWPMETTRKEIPQTYYPPTCIWDSQLPLLFQGKSSLAPKHQVPAPFSYSRTMLQPFSLPSSTWSHFPSTLDFSSISLETWHFCLLPKKIPSSPTYPSATTPFSSFFSGVKYIHIILFLSSHSLTNPF